MNLPLANGRYIDQWETPIDEWLALAYGRDQIKNMVMGRVLEQLHIAHTYPCSGIWLLGIEKDCDRDQTTYELESS